MRQWGGGLRSTLGPLVSAMALAACSGVGASPTPVHVAKGSVEIDVIGDSLSTGAQTPGDPWTREAQQYYAHRRNVTFVNEAENGAGYVARGVYGSTFADEVARAVGPRSDVVLLFGSDNDLGQPGLTQAVATTLQRVHALAPHAEVIVVGPPAPPAQQPQQLTGIRDTLADAAQRIGGRFVDPMALGWFQGDTADDVANDAEHPNADGEKFLARQMTAILAPSLARLRL